MKHATEGVGGVKEGDAAGGGELAGEDFHEGWELFVEDGEGRVRCAGLDGGAEGLAKPDARDRRVSYDRRREHVGALLGANAYGQRDVRELV